MKRLLAIAICCLLSGCGTFGFANLFGAGQIAAGKVDAATTPDVKPTANNPEAKPDFKAKDLEKTISEGIKKPIINPKLLTLCAPLSDPPPNATRMDLLLTHGKDVAIHDNCADKTESLIHLVCETFQIKECIK